MFSLSNFCLRVVFIGCILGSISACNELPTDLGSDIIPGTDSIFSLASDSAGGLLTSKGTHTERQPLYNTPYLLFGKTKDTEARLFIEFINYPAVKDPSEWDVVESSLEMYPQRYCLGDTTSSTFQVRGYNITQSWSSQITWDSVWAADGSTPYYNATGTPVCDAVGTVTHTDSVVRIPFNNDETKRWLVIGADSARRKQELFGIVLLCPTVSSIRQFRNFDGSVQKMLLRVITKHRDSTSPDTLFLMSSVAGFVNSPAASENEMVIQGARIHSTQFGVNVNGVPEHSVVVGATFRVSLNMAQSVVGNEGPDEILELRYTPANGRQLRFQTRITSANEYVFPNISAIIQHLRANGGSGTIELLPADSYVTWRTNRLVLHSLTDSEDGKPKLTILYTVPTMLR